MKDFVDKITKRLESMVGDTYNIVVREHVRVNDIKLYALNFLQKNQKCAKNIYLEPYYAVHQMGFSIEEMARKILDELNDEKEYISMLEGYSLIAINDFDEVKDNIVVRIVSQQYNQEFLKDKYYIPFLDLAIILYLIVDRDDIGISSIAITKQMVSNWNVSDEELKEVSNANMKRLFPARIKSLADVMLEECEQLQIESTEIMDEVKNCEVEMYVLSTENSMNGAVLMLDDIIMKEFADEHGVEQVIIIPSSLHECMLVPKKDDMRLTEEHCLQMLRDANLGTVRREDLLSNNLYIYDKSKNEVTMWND